MNNRHLVNNQQVNYPGIQIPLSVQLNYTQVYIEVPLSVEFKHCFHIGDSLLLQTHAHSVNTGVRGKFTVVAKQAISAVVEGLQQEMTEAKSSTKVTVSPIAV